MITSNKRMMGLSASLALSFGSVPVRARTAIKMPSITRPSKYKPHQGKQEMARRAKRLELAK